MSEIQKEGMWSVKSFQPSGIFLILLWLVEAVGIVLMTPLTTHFRFTIYLLRKLTTAHPDKPVVAISVYPNCLSDEWVSDEQRENNATETEKAYNEIVPEVVASLGAENLHFIAGRDILTDFTGLSGDLLHPCTFGHALMGMNLAERLKEILKR